LLSDPAHPFTTATAFDLSTGLIREVGMNLYCRNVAIGELILQSQDFIV
jgi:hypothetical protein